MIAAAYDTGLLAALAEPRTPEALAAACGTDVRATRIVLRALAGCGVAVRRDDGTHALAGRGRLLLEPGEGPDPLGGILLAARDMAAQVRLAEVVRTGRPLHDVSEGDAATRARFARAMRDVAAPRARVTAATLAPPPGGWLLDVGGAPGSYAVPFARAGWRVTVLDLPDTLEVNAATLRDAGVEAVAGDMTRALPAGPWDCVYLGNVVHLFPPAEAAALVARAGAVVAPGGRLAVQEVVTGLARTAPGFGVTMLAGTHGGDAYHLDEYRAWMAAAGCPVSAVVAVEPGLHHLLVGHRR